MQYCMYRATILQLNRFADTCISAILLPHDINYHNVTWPFRNTFKGPPQRCLNDDKNWHFQMFTNLYMKVVRLYDSLCDWTGKSDLGYPSLVIRLDYLLSSWTSWFSSLSTGHILHFHKAYGLCWHYLLCQRVFIQLFQKDLFIKCITYHSKQNCQVYVSENGRNL
jgi:hypothetical protein